MLAYTTPSQAARELGVRMGNPKILSPAIASLVPFPCETAISLGGSEVLQMHPAAPAIDSHTAAA